MEMNRLLYSTAISCSPNHLIRSISTIDAPTAKFHRPPLLLFVFSMAVQPSIRSSIPCPIEMRVSRSRIDPFSVAGAGTLGLPLTPPPTHNGPSSHQEGFYSLTSWPDRCSPLVRCMQIEMLEIMLRLDGRRRRKDVYLGRAVR